MKAFVLAIDIGTSGVKAILTDRQGHSHGAAYRTYPTHFPHADYAEQDPEQILQAVREVIAEITTTHAHHIAAVAFSAAMHSLVVLDSAGRALTPLITWGDLRGRREAAALRSSDTGQRFYEITGTPIHPMSPLCKLLWLKAQRPELFRQAATFAGIKDFVFMRLFGVRNCDYSLASATGLFDIRARRWSDEVLTYCGIDSAQLPTPVPTTQVYHSNTLPGLAADLPIIIGGSDGCLAHFGSGISASDTLSVTIGTSGAVRRSTPHLRPDAAGRLFNYWLDEHTLITGGATNNAFSVFQWFGRLTGSDVTVAEIDSALATTTPGADGCIFLPYLLGERAPFYDPDLRGAFIGLTARHDRAHLVRAMAEGICFALHTIADALTETSGPYTGVVASGGFIHSTRWLQLLANVLQTDVTVRDPADASALGAGRLAWQVLGHEAPAPNAESAVYRPQADHPHGEGYRRFRELQVRV